MDGSPTESGYDQLPISSSLTTDFSQIALQQASTGGVGTTVSHGTAASSSLAFGPGIMTPAPSDCSLSFDSASSPAISVENQRATPETSHSDQESDSSSPGRRGPFRCNYAGCTSKKKVFKLQCQLKKHTNNHTRPWKCDYCTSFRGGAERKDLARHLRTRHPERADPASFKEWALCARCGHGEPMRADNLKRHLKTFIWIFYIRE
ncbi:hypothetical protein F5144DRAFT_603142 [Chaetomium tenue]|uniref:Uncharacterized protein n=1 Tax=Chaetomium tenue TaxID=1854479 RepID=A0ACB7P839_9PEZI|nr:hypothetical protein F5144DRAFT_603142 [Chaetomium globosum]